MSSACFHEQNIIKKLAGVKMCCSLGHFPGRSSLKVHVINSQTATYSALPLILSVFIRDFASLTQFTLSFHFHAYLMNQSPICYVKDYRGQ